MKIAFLSLMLTLGFTMNAHAGLKCTGVDEDGSYILTQGLTKDKKKAFLLEGTGKNGEVRVLVLEIKAAKKNSLGSTLYKGTFGADLDTEFVEMGKYTLTLPKVLSNQAKVVLDFQTDFASSSETLPLKCKNILNTDKSVN